MQALTSQLVMFKHLTALVQDMPQTECQVNHKFSAGVYLREILIPKNTLAIGKIHTTNHFNIVAMGEVLLTTTLKKLHVKAPYTFESLAGEQKIAFALEDTVIINILPTNKTDVDSIEKEFVTLEYTEELLASVHNHFTELLK